MHTDQSTPSQPPSAEEVLANPATSFWLQSALRSATQRDPVDAVHDAELLLAILRQRLDNLQAWHAAHARSRRRTDGD